jgi:hypothetical protein
MKVHNMIRFCNLLGLIALAGWSFDASAADKPQADISQKLTEMSVLTGDVWQKMAPDEKVAFVWGIGHVVTIERQVTERYPELKREGFVAKLAEGLVGVPMNTIVLEIDKYYKENPYDLGAPVMEVIWDEMVKPKIRSGIANLPLN